MSLTFPYRLRRMKEQIATLGGRWVIPRPAIYFSVESPSAVVPMFGLLDTGSDECYFPLSEAYQPVEQLASAANGIRFPLGIRGVIAAIWHYSTGCYALGLDLSTARFGRHRGIDGHFAQVRYADVVFRLSDGRSYLEWTALVGFTTAPLRFALLGFAGFLQFFTAEFEGDYERVTLAANALFPASPA